MAGNILTPQDVEKDRAARIAAAASSVTLADYNDTLENYLKEVRFARGYTDRSPVEYRDSKVARWAQDARDWADFMDRVMLYALDKLNMYESTGEPPCTLEKFEEELRGITCGWKEE